LIEASRVWGLKLIEANALLSELMREGLVYKTETGRYSIKGSKI
jgi:DNA-binding IclR family transcriptional regulator